MANVKIRHLVERPRRGGVAYYWQPAARLVKAGFRVQSLGRDLVKAIELAEAFNEKVDAFYAGAPLDARRGPAPGTLAWVADAFQRDTVKWPTLSARTKKDFIYNIKPALDWAGDVQATKITKKAVMAWVGAIYKPIDKDDRSKGGLGHGNGRNAAAALRRLLSWALKNGFIKVHPAKDLDLPVPVSRDRVWTEMEMEAMVKAAIDAGLPSMALAIQINWWLGQRPADLRVLAWSGYDGKTIWLRQQKSERLGPEGGVSHKGVMVHVPVPPELRSVLDSAPRTSTQIIVSEETKRPYQESAFQHTFARIRAKARIRCDYGSDIPMPEDLQFRDLRRTVATTIGSEGGTAEEIQSVGGWTTTEILKTYVRPDDRFAKNAMGKLEKARRKAEG